jgi:glycosyltransferase
MLRFDEPLDDFSLMSDTGTANFERRRARFYDLKNLPLSIGLAQLYQHPLERLLKISVITVCFNSAKTIGRAIESFLRQDHQDKEAIIIDGMSSDETVSIVQSFKSPIVKFLSEPDAGIYDAMNKGLQLYTGDAVGFLNSDDMFHDQRVLSKVALALADVDVVYGDLNMVTSHIGKATRRRWRPGPYKSYSFQLGWAAPHPTFYLTRNAAETVGGFDVRYSIAADYDLMIRALHMHRLKWRYIPETFVDFQLGGMSTRGWGAFLTANLECLAIRRRQLGSPPVDLALFLRPARRIFQLRRTPAGE